MRRLRSFGRRFRRNRISQPLFWAERLIRRHPGKRNANAPGVTQESLRSSEAAFGATPARMPASDDSPQRFRRCPARQRAKRLRAMNRRREKYTCNRRMPCKTKAESAAARPHRPRRRLRSATVGEPEGHRQGGGGPDHLHGHLRARHDRNSAHARPGRHTVILRQNYLSRQSSNCPRRRYDGNLVQMVDQVISRKDQNRSPLVGIPSQPFASQASGSSSAGNSSRSS